MGKAIIVLTDGFEEIEALATVDILRRGGVEVTMVSLTNTLEVKGGHGIVVHADTMFADADFAVNDALIIPGGTAKFNEHDGLKQRVMQYAEANKTIAAICAAPMVLGELGLLEGRQATCYPGFEKYLRGAQLQNGAAVVVDGAMITGRGPGLALDFALQVLRTIAGREKHDEIAKGLLLTN